MFSTIAGHSTRRELLRRAGLAAGALALGASRRAGAQPPAVGVRRSIGSLDPRGPEVAAYRAGVEAMRCRSAGDPTSWLAQAQIHLDSCPHGNWFFLPWHRAYLLYFERICRQASGDPGFTLPYWDWTAQPEVPAPLWGCGALGDCSRDVLPSAQADPEFVGPEVIRDLLAITDFATFASAPARASCPPPGPDLQRKRCGSGRLEATPHNYVHRFVGGDMASFWSPLDPVFWLHHANVDRLWTEWNKLHPNTGEAAWRDFEFEGNFVDPDGDPVDVRVRDLLDTHALGYRYDTQDAEPRSAPRGAAAPPREETLAKVSNSRPAASAAPLTVTIAPDAELAGRLRSLTEGGGRTAAPTTLRLEVEVGEEPASRVGLRVYVNRPDVSLETPVEDPHYVGSVTFFPQEGAHGRAGGHHSGGTTFLFDLADTVRELGRSRRFEPAAPVQVQILPVALDGRPGVSRAAEEPVTPTAVRLTWVEG